MANTSYLLQANSRMAGALVREYSGDQLIGLFTPLGWGGLVMLAFVMRSVVAAFFLEHGYSEDWPRKLGRWLDHDFPPEELTLWLALCGAIVALGYLRYLGILGRRWTKLERSRWYPGASIFMRISNAGYVGNEANYAKHWLLTQVVAEPILGLCLSVAVWQLSPSLGFYISNLFLMLWIESMGAARRRRAMRLSFQEAMAWERHQREIFEEAKSWKERRSGA